MSKYWVISPFDSDKTDLYEAAWAFCLSDGLISVGRTFPIDISVSSQDELRSLVSKHYAHKTKNVQSWKLSMFWNFYNEISAGDVILARKGLKVISGVGIVSAGAYFQYKKNKAAVGEEFAFHHHLNIDWLDEPRDIIVENSGFRRGAFLQEIDLVRFISLIRSELGRH